MSGRKQLIVNADDFGFTPGRKPRHRRRAPHGHPHGDDTDGERSCLRRCATSGARDTHPRHRLPSGAGGRTIAGHGEGIPAHGDAIVDGPGAPRNPAVRRVVRAGAAHSRCRHPPDAPRHAQAHPSRAAGARRGSAHRRGVRDSVGAAAIRLSADGAARHSPTTQAR